MSPSEPAPAAGPEPRRTPEPAPASATGRAPRASVPRVLAVADSDSYLKWAAATLDTLGAAGETVLLSSPVLPSAAQVRAATHGTRAGAAPVPVVTLAGLRHRLRGPDAPDAVLVACTGPAAQVVVAAARRLPGGGPALVAGLPGVALPPSGDAVRLRSGVDAFVVHSSAERDAFVPLVDRWSPGTRVVLGRLPFLPAAVPAAVGRVPGVRVVRVVFAPQALVPADRADRLRVLDALADVAASGVEVVVKLRGRAGERQTHDERWPYDRLATSAHRALRFETGPLSAWLVPGSALVTVTSTAALEALAGGFPAIVLDDVGAGPDAPGAGTFDGSGLRVPVGELVDVVAAGGLAPAPQWLASSPLAVVPELAEALAGLSAAPRVTASRVRPSLRSRARLVLPPRAAAALGSVVARLGAAGAVRPGRSV